MVDIFLNEARALFFFHTMLAMGWWNMSRSYKLVQSPIAVIPLEQSFYASLVANTLSLCLWVQFYGFYCCGDEHTGKPCNDREKHSLGERENTQKLWGTQAASGHNASSSAAEELATETAGNGYNSPAIKTTYTGPLSTLINDLIIVSMKQIIQLAQGHRSSLCCYT